MSRVRHHIPPHSDEQRLARGKKTGGKDFKPGVSGNPAGSSGLPQDLRDARKMTAAEVTRILTRLVDMTPEEFEVYKPRTVLEKIVITVARIAMVEGCTNRLNLIFDRIIGKVKDKLEIDLPVPFIVKRLDGSEIIMGARLNKKEGEE